MKKNKTTAAMTLAALSLLILAGCAAPELRGCSKDARICPDGSAVGRMPPNCEFEQCPEVRDAKETDDSKEPLQSPEKAFESAQKIIFTRMGDLTLKYSDGKAALSGTLQRSTPCVDWQVEVKGSESLVEFNIFNKNKGAICIQVLGTPQNVSATAGAAHDLSYKVFFENELVFDGKLS